MHMSDSHGMHLCMHLFTWHAPRYQAAYVVSAGTAKRDLRGVLDRLARVGAAEAAAKPHPNPNFNPNPNPDPNPDPNPNPNPNPDPNSNPNPDPNPNLRRPPPSTRRCAG